MNFCYSLVLVFLFNFIIIELLCIVRKRWTMDMRFGFLNVRSLYRAGSLVTVSKEQSKCKLYLMECSGTEPAGERIHIFLRKGKCES
jgi:hypothetical protein